MERLPPQQAGHEVVDVTYEGRPDGLVFAVGDKRLQLVYVRNSSARHRVMAKIQSTASRRFRVRPGFAVLGPHESVGVQIQLLPSERDASECKFLLVVRRVDEEQAPIPSAEHASTAADEKQMWQRAEARQHASLVLSETIVARVVLAANDTNATRVEARSLSPQTKPSVPTTEPAPAKTLPPAPPPPPPEQELCIDPLEARAQVVALLMRSQSRLPANRLAPEQLAALRRLRDRCAAQWPALEADARRMRALARQFAARDEPQRRPPTEAT